MVFSKNKKEKKDTSWCFQQVIQPNYIKEVFFIKKKYIYYHLINLFLKGEIMRFS